MARYGQQPDLNRPWVAVIPDGCTCKWINYSDNGGWYLRGADQNCPVHGTADQH